MKKIFGLPIVLFTIGLLVIGTGTALVVNYLSNTATAQVTVESPMSIQFATIGAVGGNGGFDEPTWTNYLVMDATTGLSTSTLGVKIVNNADIAIEGKWLELKVNTSNPITDVSCDDISSLMFWDIGASVASGNFKYQELKSLCVDEGDYVVYNIDINSLAAGETYKYPVKLTFGIVESAKYHFSAVLLNELPIV